MPIQELLTSLGAEIEDPEEGSLASHLSMHVPAKYVSESFLLFSQSIPSQDLGFIDSKATTLELTIGGHDLTIHQSPTVLSSNRHGGTTGAGTEASSEKPLVLIDV
jgi:hypothetical protein